MLSIIISNIYTYLESPYELIFAEILRDVLHSRWVDDGTNTLPGGLGFRHGVSVSLGDDKPRDESDKEIIQKLKNKTRSKQYDQSILFFRMMSSIKLSARALARIEKRPVHKI